MRWILPMACLGKMIRLTFLSKIIDYAVPVHVSIMTVWRAVGRTNTAEVRRFIYLRFQMLPNCQLIEQFPYTKSEINNPPVIPFVINPWQRGQSVGEWVHSRSLNKECVISIVVYLRFQCRSNVVTRHRFVICNIISFRKYCYWAYPQWIAQNVRKVWK